MNNIKPNIKDELIKKDLSIISETLKEKDGKISFMGAIYFAYCIGARRMESENFTKQSLCTPKGEPRTP